MESYADTTRSLRDLSLSLSHLSNDIHDTVTKKDRLYVPNLYSGMRSSLSSRSMDARNSRSSFSNFGASNIAVNVPQSILKKSSQFSNCSSRPSSASMYRPSSASMYRPSSASMYRPSVRDFRSSSSIGRNQSFIYNTQPSQTGLNSKNYFPVTLSNSYYGNSPSTYDLPTSSYSQRSYTNDRLYDSELYENPNDTIDSLQTMIERTSDLVAASVPNLSPFEETNFRLKLKRLRLEKERWLELKRQEELEMMRGPEPKWYERRDRSFHYESHKNTRLIRNQEKWSDLLLRREELLRESLRLNALYL